MNKRLSGTDLGFCLCWRRLLLSTFQESHMFFPNKPFVLAIDRKKNARQIYASHVYRSLSRSPLHLPHSNNKQIARVSKSSINSTRAATDTSICLSHNHSPVFVFLFEYLFGLETSVMWQFNQVPPRVRRTRGKWKVHRKVVKGKRQQLLSFSPMLMHFSLMFAPAFFSIVFYFSKSPSPTEMPLK